MSSRFQELDYRVTPMGELTLRRRQDPTTNRDVHEIKLDDEFLMSSQFTVSETELGTRALADLDGTSLDVAVGGLGLGYTAAAVLQYPNVESLIVIDALVEVIEWHERALIPTGAALTSDPRCRFVHGDFFAMLSSSQGLDPGSPDRRFHAIIVDIDHSPEHVLHASHAEFYQPAGLQRLSEHLHPAGVFALWSNDPPDGKFTAALSECFAHVRAEVVSFDNPLQDRQATSTVYLATTESAV